MCMIWLLCMCIRVCNHILTCGQHYSSICVHMCAYICVYMCAYICVYIYAYICVYMCAYIYCHAYGMTPPYVCIHVCIYVFVCVCAYIRVYMCACIYFHVYDIAPVCVYAYTFACIYLHVHNMNINMCVMHVCIHMFTRVWYECWHVCNTPLSPVSLLHMCIYVCMHILLWHDSSVDPVLRVPSLY